MSINKRTVAAVGAVVLAILGVASLVLYANDAKDRAFEGAELVSVLQVVESIPAGTKAEDIGAAASTVRLPKTAVPSTALAGLDSVSGEVTTATLVPGEVLVSGRFGDKEEVNGGSKVSVPKGLQEITISVDPVRGLNGDLAPGDTVGVLASYDDAKKTNFALNRALVLDASDSAAGSGEDLTPNLVVRLAVSSVDAAKIVNAAQFGYVYLTKQGPDAEVDRQFIGLEDVLR